DLVIDFAANEQIFLSGARVDGNNRLRRRVQGRYLFRCQFDHVRLLSGILPRDKFICNENLGGSALALAAAAATNWADRIATPACKHRLNQRNMAVEGRQRPRFRLEQMFGPTLAHLYQSPRVSGRLLS